MNVPFRQQVSNYDCVPTTFVNALSYLFQRHEIPPYVVQRIYRECLDAETAPGRDRGTTSRAIHDLAHWLKHYRDPRYSNFAVHARFLTGYYVHLKQNSRIIQCLDGNGAVLLCIHSRQSFWHYILGIDYDDNWLHCYDPFPHTNRFIKNDAVQFNMNACHQDPNLIIRFDWLDRTFHKARAPDEHKYILGSHDCRECLLLTRSNTP